MHKSYKSLSKLEIELNQLEKTIVKPVNRGNIYLFYLVCWFVNSFLQMYAFVFSVSFEGLTPNLDISHTKLRELIESSYPNPLTIDDINK